MCPEYLFHCWKKDLCRLEHWTWILPGHRIITGTFMKQFMFWGTLGRHVYRLLILTILCVQGFFPPLHYRWANSSHKRIIIQSSISILMGLVSGLPPLQIPNLKMLKPLIWSGIVQSAFHIHGFLIRGFLIPRYQEPTLFRFFFFHIQRWHQ